MIRKKLDLQRNQQKREIMLVNLNAINDPAEREYFRNKKQQILNRNTIGGSSSNILNHETFTSQDGYVGVHYAGGGYEGSQYGIPDYRGSGYGGDDLPEY